jgi:hypothetical protein
MSEEKKEKKVGRPFAAGNAGGPGRPSRDVESRFLNVLSTCTTDEEWTKIVKVAIIQAQQGRAPARDWLSKYLLPKPEALWAAEQGGDQPEGLVALLAIYSERARVAEEQLAAMRARLEKLEKLEGRGG